VNKSKGGPSKVGERTFFRTLLKRRGDDDRNAGDQEPTCKGHFDKDRETRSHRLRKRSSRREWKNISKKNMGIRRWVGGGRWI